MAYQTEWATDLLFKDPRALAGLFPLLVRHAIHHFKSPDVMRFLAPKAHGNFTGEIITSFKDIAEGVRVKHWTGTSPPPRSMTSAASQPRRAPATRYLFEWILASSPNPM